jgi:lipoprotein signal peptidase
LTPVSRATRSFAATRAQWLALAAIALAAVVADQVTKHVVASNLRLGEGVHVVGPFTIRHVQNSGIAFGLFSNATASVIVVTAIAIAWMLVYFARSGARHPVLPVALGLVIGGSVSNLADRVRLGFVTDFLDFRYWPAFNLADSFIVIGVGILLAALVLPSGSRGRPRLKRSVPPEAAGERLDRYLAGLPDVGSRAAAERLLAAGPCSWTGGARGRATSSRRGGARDRAAGAGREPDVAPPELTIAYADEHLLVVDKPAGVVVLPAPGHACGTLAQALATAGAEGGRRTGPESSNASTATPQGLLVVARFARDLRAAATARAAPEELTREYLALVVGQAALATRHDRRADRPRSARPLPHSLDTDHATLRPRRTSSSRRSSSATRSCASAREPAGTHQIRVHSRAIDLPVAGEPGVRDCRRARAGAAVPPRGAPRLRAPGDRRGGGRLFTAPARPGHRARGGPQLTFRRLRPYSPAAQPWRACLSLREVRLDSRRLSTTNQSGRSFPCLFNRASFD